MFNSYWFFYFFSEEKEILLKKNCSSRKVNYQLKVLKISRRFQRLVLNGSFQKEKFIATLHRFCENSWNKHFFSNSESNSRTDPFVIIHRFISGLTFYRNSLYSVAIPTTWNVKLSHHHSIRILWWSSLWITTAFRNLPSYVTEL